MTEKERSVLQNNPLFEGLDEAQTDRQMDILKAERAHCERGEMLQAPGEAIRRFGIVLSGAVQVCADDIEGRRMIMAEVPPGVSFGESLCFLRTTESPVCIFASEESELIWLTTDGLYTESDAVHREIQQRFTAMLAMKALSMNNRIQVLSKLSLRDKLTAYFTEISAGQGSNTIRLPLNREDTAAYIGTNRSALSRELAKMKREGLIDYRKNEIRLLRQDESGS